MQSSVYATCTDWNFFRGITYLLQRGVDSLSHTAQCQWAASVDLLPCAKRAIRAGKPISDQGYLLRSTGFVYTRWTAIYVLQKKQQARRSSARGKLESEKVGLPWA